MKKLLILLLVGLSLTASAQWQGITGTPQKNTSTGAVRWNFGANGVSMMISSVDTSRTSGGATFDPTTGVLSIPKGGLFTGSNGIKQTGNNFSIGGPNVLLPIGINLEYNSSANPSATGQFSIQNTLNGNRSLTGSFGRQLLTIDGTGLSLTAKDSTFSGAPATGSSGSWVNVKHGHIDIEAFRWTGGTSAQYSGIDLTVTGTPGVAVDATAKAGFALYSNGTITSNATQAIISRDYSGGQVTHTLTKGMQVTDDSDLIGFLYKDKNYDGRNYDSWIPTWLKVKGRIDSAITAAASSGTPAWSSITGKPTTIAGYGITDAYSTSNPSNYITLTSHSGTAPITYNSSTGAIGITQATTSTNGYLSNTDWNTFNGKQAALSGTGFVKISGTAISYDNSTYLTTGTAASTYSPLASPIFTGTVTIPSLSMTGAIIPNVTNTYDIGSSSKVLANLYANNGYITNLYVPNGYIQGGGLYFQGSTSGTTGITVQPTTGNYNFNLPTTAGTLGYFLTSGGGGSSAMTWTNLANYAFGSPTATTQAALDNSTKVSTTAYTDAAVNATAVYFSASLFGGAGTSGSPYTLGNGIVGISNLSATGTADGTHFLAGDNTWKTITGASGANPTASAGLTAINGVSTSFMRADAAPAIDQTIIPVWTGLHTFSTTNTASSGASTANYGTYIHHTVNQTGTAGFSDLYINRTNTAPGSGSQNLINAAVGGSSVFNVNTSGGITTSSSVTINGTYTNQQFSSSGTFSADGVYLFNSATSSAGNPSLNSLRLRYMASVWNTTPTAAANYAHIISELRTTSGTAPTYKLYWAANLSTSTTPGTFTDIMNLNNSGDLAVLRAFTPGAVTFANVPASPTQGMMIFITDSSATTVGSTITGGGSTKVWGGWNGTNWVVMAK